MVGSTELITKNGFHPWGVPLFLLLASRLLRTSKSGFQQTGAVITGRENTGILA